MKRDDIIVVAEIQELLSKLHGDSLEEVVGFIQHCIEVDSLLSPKEKAKVEIQKAFTTGFDF